MNLPSRNRKIRCDRQVISIGQGFAGAVVSSILAHSAIAGVWLFSSGPTFQTDDLVSFNLIAASDNGEIIHGIDKPTIIPMSGHAGLHQVWTPVTSSATPTRGDHTPPLWSDIWLPYDSHWFFTSANSLSVGGTFTETNSGVNGASLPSDGFGAPETGFGSMAFTGSGAFKSFAIDSGLRGANVEFAQLVMRTDEAVLVSLNILHSVGSTEFDEVAIGCIIHCGEPLQVVDESIEVLPAPVNHHQFDLNFNGLPLDPALATWELISFDGPDGEVPTNAPSLSPNGLFSWQMDFDDLLGPAFPKTWLATVRATYLGLVDEGTLIIGLVPEPASATLLGMALIAASGIRRRSA